MKRCIVIGNEPGGSFLVLSRDGEKLEELMRQWVETYRKFIEERTATYVKSYRTVLDIPLDASLESERELIHERFGTDPFENQGFAALVQEAESTYEKNRMIEPDWREWFKNQGFKTRLVEYIIDFSD